MSVLVNLFGKSPFGLLRSHMDKVADCVYKLPPLFEALEIEDGLLTEKICTEICNLEHQADITKNEIRNHLPKGLFLPIDKAQLLAILSVQDKIADNAEDIALLVTLKQLPAYKDFKEEFLTLLDKNLEAFKGAQDIIIELHELLESSFGGIEAEKVKMMVERVAVLEHEADVMQRPLLKKLFTLEDKMSYSSYDLWNRIFQKVVSLSDLSENLANRVRMTLEIS